jgi:guanylate kinase
MAVMKRLTILSGPSCVGKGPLQAVVKKFYPGLIDARPVMCTSRPARKSETQGKDFYFLPESFFKSLEKSPDFIVSPVRTDWQAIHLPQFEELLHNNNLVFAEVYYTFVPVLLECAANRGFENIRIFLLPLPLNTPSEHIIEVMKTKLQRRGTDSPEKIRDRSVSAPLEITKASTYTHRLVNPAGEDDTDEWKLFGTYAGENGQGEVNSIDDLGLNARWLVKTFIKIVKGELPSGDYSREDS